MGKSNRQGSQQSKKKEKASAAQDGGKQKFSLPRQLLILLLSFIFISVLLNEVRGYNWVIKTMLMKNLEVINKYENLSLEEKYQAKLGFNYFYLDYLVKNTPEDAIILMPDKEVVYQKSKSNKFRKQSPYLIGRKIPSTYFVYPRKLVYESEKDSSAIYSDASHVAIINNWGYDKLNYQVQNRVLNTVLPINQNTNNHPQ